MAFRQKEPLRFRSEIQATVERYNARWLFMADNILPAKYYGDFMQWARQRGLQIDFFYEIKANVTRRHVADLAEAGVSMVQPGIESFSSPILSLMKKGVRGAQNIAFLKYAAEEGLIAAYNLLAGFPGEDPFEYERMSRELPKLFHLRPPNGLSVVEFHRFSPYHNAPEVFGLRLRPHPNYGFIYPLEARALDGLAYFFEVEGRSAGDLSYLAAIRRVIDEWRTQYDETVCRLTWRRDGAAIVVEDTRPHFGPRAIRLSRAAAALLEAFDSPTTLAAAAASLRGLESSEPARPRPGETLIDFSAAELARDPKGCLRRLGAYGLTYEEDGLHVALPVSAAARAVEPGWAQVVA
jgi:ribosomal peptide maturation radical SAM protein 1